MTKKEVKYFEIKFKKLSLGARICTSLVTSIILSFIFMIIFNSRCRLTFFIIFLALFILIFLFSSSEYLRAHTFTKKKAKLDILKTVKFRLKNMHKISAYLIMIFLSAYTIFLIIFIIFKFSLFNLFLILILLFTIIIYYLLFFYNRFSYSICKQGLLIKGIHTPKLYNWKDINRYKKNKKIISIYFKRTKYQILLYHKKGVDKFLKKFVKKRK